MGNQSATAKIARKMREMKASGKTWRQIAAHWGINPGTAYRIATQGYEPLDSALRQKLGLPQVCPHCHRRYRPQPKMRRWRRLSDLKPAEIIWLLEHREEM